MSQITFALIGCGRIGHRHAQHISAKGKLQIVCDIDEEKARILANEYGCAYTTSVDELLKRKA
ncbi:MAG TPA: Gfo/Idh/MocA family oxidoreductase, partial [Ohtaekwangia sp.]|nr:Gfo/Idh/MocA family oxidoreductase [Ohtaekwangia sp.]